MPLVHKHVFDGEVRAILDNDLLADECMSVDDNGPHQVHRDMLRFVGVDGHNVEHHRRRGFLNLERLDILIPEQDFVTIQQVARSDDNELHGRLSFGHQRPEDLERHTFPAGLEFKNAEVAEADEAKGKVHHKFLRCNGALLE